MRREFTVLVHREDGSYWASVPELPGCFSHGLTIEELRENVREAIELYLDGQEVGSPTGEFVGVERIALPA